MRMQHEVLWMEGSSRCTKRQQCRMDGVERQVEIEKHREKEDGEGQGERRMPAGLCTTPCSSCVLGLSERHHPAAAMCCGVLSQSTKRNSVWPHHPTRQTPDESSAWLVLVSTPKHTTSLCDAIIPSFFSSSALCFSGLSSDKDALCVLSGLLFVQKAACLSVTG